MLKRIWLVGVAAATMAGAGAVQAQTATPGPDDVYELGELTVTARNRQGERVGGEIIRGEDLRRFDRVSVDQALDLVAGAASGATGGSRNERLVFIRGFDRFQTTLSIDGVRVFLPADNRIDFARFLTADLSQVQVSKGYVSVLDGPGGMGGAINLVTRRPTAPFEGELRAGAGFDADLGVASRSLSGRLGGANDHGYAQISGAWNDRDHWSLPDDFQPTALEDGGERDRTATEDWRFNVKLGLTPNADDEYSLTYTRQEGSKNAPTHVGDTANRRYWSWPYWNLDSLAFLSRTGLGETAWLKTRLYRNTFDNALFAYDDARQTSQTSRRAFRSYYKDQAVGGNLEIGLRATTDDTLRAAAYWRRDEHVERQQSFAPAPFTEPNQVTVENTYSLAVENTHAFGQSLDLIVGASIDWRDLKRAEDFNDGRFVQHPLTDDTVVNYQAMLVYRPNTMAEVYASVSSRARFPTLFERFSSRFGTAIPNPGVTAERAVNYEVGGWYEPRVDLRLEGAVFYSDLDDALIQVPVDLGPPFGVINQTRNAGSGRYYGLEATGRMQLTPELALNGNYTWLKRTIDNPSDPNFRTTDAPEHKLFAWLDWRVNDRVVLTPSLEAWSGRWTYAVVAPQGYYKIDDAVLAHLSAQVVLTHRVDLIIGARNLMDELYVVTDGFPEEGRNFRADLRMRF
ncbi:MAG: TonB-dependent receptor [Caulobacterales bacterium]|nr:TonB-dependent receptor [Caulobacterales bacterium]